MYYQTCDYYLRVLDPIKNKKANHFLRNYIRWSKNSTIFTIYSKPCDSNIKAYYAIKEQMYVDNGFDFRCGNHSTHRWSCAYRIPYGEKSLLIYHTRDNVYCIFYSALSEIVNAYE